MFNLKPNEMTFSNMCGVVKILPNSNKQITEIYAKCDQNQLVYTWNWTKGMWIENFKIVENENDPE